MSGKVIRDLRCLHPILRNIHYKILKEVIDTHNMPIRLFETGRSQKRHQNLIEKGREFSLISPQIYDLENDPPLYCTALCYVYFDKRWSWNLRNASVTSWYVVFANMVLDACPELEWGGYNRKNSNLSLFTLKTSCIENNYKKYPCMVI